MNISIPSSYIRQYVLSHYEQKGKICSSGRELVMESIFVENDKKRHMSVNLETGLWQCFKSSRSGNFVSLYCHTEGIKFFQAYRKILKDSVFSYTENNSYIGNISLQEKKELFDITKTFIPINLKSFESEDSLVLDAWKYLYDRKVLSENFKNTFYISTDPLLKNRVIIPYEKDDILYFFEGRALSNGMNPKYLAPSQNMVKKSEILYPYNEEDDCLVVCEGAFDAISLKIQGINATSTGTAYVSKIQAEILRSFPGRVIMGYNKDNAGKKGTSKFYDFCKATKMLDLYVCFPPEEFKDWNECLKADVDIKSWIENNSRKYDSFYVLDNLASSL